MRAGDPPRDLRQGLVALSFELETVIQDDDGVRLSSPLAQQPRAGLEQKSRRQGASSVRLDIRGKRP